jgi:peptidoglycan hydrolase-like protein with peptidoglycan-binding domain
MRQTVRWKGARAGTADPGRHGPLEHGMRIDEDVRQLQEALKNQGHDPGAVDGVMGQKTQQALRDFQKSKNFEATGRLDDQTANALGVPLKNSAGRS